jgi:hypothetical protein
MAGPGARGGAIVGRVRAGGSLARHDDTAVARSPWSVSRRLAFLLVLAVPACAGILGIDDPRLKDGGAADARSPDDGASDAAHADGGSGDTGAICQGVDDLGGVSERGAGCLEIVARAQDDPYQVLVVADFVYWTNFGRLAPGNVMRAALDGTNAAPFAPPSAHPKFLAEHGGLVYWGDQTSAEIDEASDQTWGSVHRRATDGGAIEVVDTDYAIRGLVATDTHAYWVMARGAVRRRPLDGGPSEIVAAGEYTLTGLDIDDGGVVRTSGGEVDSGAGGGVRQTRHDATAGWQISSIEVPWGVRIHGDFVYWTERGRWDGGLLTGGTGNVKRAARRDGQRVETLCFDQPAPLFLAVDATHVYFTNQGHGAASGQLARVAKGGGAVEVLVDGLARPHGIGIGGSYVYFTTRGDGRVWRWHKN